MNDGDWLENFFSIEENSEELDEASEFISKPAEKILFDPADLEEIPKPRIFQVEFDRGDSPSRIELHDSPCQLSEALSPEEPEGCPWPDGSSSFLVDEQEISEEGKEFDYREIVVDGSGAPRQAGSDHPDGEFIKRYKSLAERSLYLFLKGILGRHFLTDHFHRDTCNFTQTCPPFRKLILMPREHCKTTIMAGGLPAHILIQPAETNIYFPGIEGSECRILMAGETEKMAKKNLRVVKSVFEENRLFRALWPNRCWDAGTRKLKEWSTESIIIPRDNEWPDPTIRAVGVGGAITGSRPNVLIKDDLVSLKARNSEVVMEEAIEWHIASRALLDTYEVESGLQSLEWIVGTRWAVHDLYSYIQNNDPSVEVNEERYHRIIRDGEILWPEKHTQASIEQLRLEYGSLFFLLYLNNANDPSLTDFDIDLLRQFSVVDGKIVFEGDPRDAYIKKRMEVVGGTGLAQPQEIKRGQPLSLLRLSENLKGGMGCRVRV